MIAVRDRHNVGLERDATYTDLFELLLAGDKHWDQSVTNIFVQSRHLASHAVSENAKTSLVASALLFHTCQILASGSLQAGDWTSDTLYETGTYDWLFKHFGEEVAETIRLQHVAKRFLATVVPKYQRNPNDRLLQLIHSESTCMTLSERIAFCNDPFYNNALKLACWIDRGFNRHDDVPEMEFFVPFIERSLSSF